MIAFHFPLVSGLADGCRRTNVEFGLTIKLYLNIKVALKLKLIFAKKFEHTDILVVCFEFCTLFYI